MSPSVLADRSNMAVLRCYELRTLALILFVIPAVLNCNRTKARCYGEENGRSADATDERAIHSTATDAGTSSAATEIVERVVLRWCDAHNTRDLDALAALYANSVWFYGRKRDTAACVASKKGLFAKNPDFAQAIVGGVHTQVDNVEARATFLKRVTISGKATEYPSYLGLTKTAAGWKISVEGDEVTDANLQIVKGDWEGDGHPEGVRLIPPNLLHTSSNEGFDECVGPCNCRLVFERLPSITIEGCIGGVPVNEGDLNNDGTDEMGILPVHPTGWFASNWVPYLVYGLRNGKWIQVVDPIPTHYEQWRNGVDAIEKDEKNPGHVIVRSMDVADFKVKSKSVMLKAQ